VLNAVAERKDRLRPLGADARQAAQVGERRLIQIDRIVRGRSSRRHFSSSRSPRVGRQRCGARRWRRGCARRRGESVDRVRLGHDFGRSRLGRGARALVCTSGKRRSPDRRQDHEAESDGRGTRNGRAPSPCRSLSPGFGEPTSPLAQSSSDRLHGSPPALREPSCRVVRTSSSAATRRAGSIGEAGLLALTRWHRRGAHRGLPGRPLKTIAVFPIANLQSSIDWNRVELQVHRSVAIDETDPDACPGRLARTALDHGVDHFHRFSVGTHDSHLFLASHHADERPSARGVPIDGRRSSPLDRVEAPCPGQFGRCPGTGG
jgi:hypothetical protein